eukprot:CAMPEP_0179195776 /NCGR_PEP_ID=MMETSP0796-20121207/97327_1 /TAXON_ID=73915 /ORGANISM="Pyrodinium bahamense, Strain pbaha01" /LENGTH=95 /DNA_ID=CAMNT_0020900143 /DNA_START=12 /DNA_END=295 /DNA_ORIENTATION=+
MIPPRAGRICQGTRQSSAAAQRGLDAPRFHPCRHPRHGPHAESFAECSGSGTPAARCWSGNSCGVARSGTLPVLLPKVQPMMQHHQCQQSSASTP